MNNKNIQKIKKANDNYIWTARLSRTIALTTKKDGILTPFIVPFVPSQMTLKIQVEGISLWVLRSIMDDGTKDGVKELDERQLVILNVIKDDDRISVSEMAQKTSIARRTIQRELAVLQKLGILTREGGRKEGRWVILE